MSGSRTLQEQVGIRLRRVRVQRKWTLADVEEMSNGEYRAATVSSYERGDRALSMVRLAELAGLYDVSVEYLLTGRFPADADPATTIVEVLLPRLEAMPPSRLGPLAPLLADMGVAADGTLRETIRLGPGGLRLMAAVCGVSPSELTLRLTEWRAIRRVYRVIPEDSFGNEHPFDSPRNTAGRPQQSVTIPSQPAAPTRPE